MANTEKRKTPAPNPREEYAKKQAAKAVNPRARTRSGQRVQKPLRPVDYGDAR